MSFRRASLICRVTPMEMILTPESRNIWASFFASASPTSPPVGLPSVRMIATFGTFGRSPGAPEPNIRVRARLRAYDVLVVWSRNLRSPIALTRSDSLLYLNSDGTCLTGDVLPTYEQCFR